MVVQQNHKEWKRFQLIDRLKIRSCELIERQTKLVKYLSKLIKWRYLLVIGYMWCIIGYILLNMVQRQFTKHMLVQFCVFSKCVKIDGGSAKSQKVESIPIDRLIEDKIL